MNLMNEWKFLRKLIQYIHEKIAIGLVQYWSYAYNHKINPIKISGIRIQVSQKVWEQIMLPEFTQITEKYMQGNYELKYELFNKVGSVVVTWQRRGGG